MSKLIPDTDELLDRCDCGARAGFLIDDDKVCGAECTDKCGQVVYTDDATDAMTEWNRMIRLWVKIGLKNK
jgi:hypothetical protein